MMESPNVLNVLVDEARKIRYEVVAYRTLSQAELVQAVRVGLSMTKRKPKKNSTIRFITMLGMDR
jgi:hypothetical protein